MTSRARGTQVVLEAEPLEILGITARLHSTGSGIVGRLDGITPDDLNPLFQTAGAGNKGQKSRRGYSRRRGFEGGQMPLHRRMPKRGFTNIFRKEFNIVSLERLVELGETTITPDVLRKAGVIKTKHPVKILGDGELTAAITVHAHKFSKSAQDKIVKAGGKFEVLSVGAGQ